MQILHGAPSEGGGALMDEKRDVRVDFSIDEYRDANWHTIFRYLATQHLTVDEITQIFNEIKEKLEAEA
jgi:hypothetical protein